VFAIAMLKSFLNQKVYFSGMSFALFVRRLQILRVMAWRHASRHEYF
jgi:hypothetical protein